MKHMLVNNISALLGKNGIGASESSSIAKQIYKLIIQEQKDSFVLTQANRAELRHKIIIILKLHGVLDLSLAEQIMKII